MEDKQLKDIIADITEILDSATADEQNIIIEEVVRYIFAQRGELNNNIRTRIEEMEKTGQANQDSTSQLSQLLDNQLKTSKIN